MNVANTAFRLTCRWRALGDAIQSVATRVHPRWDASVPTAGIAASGDLSINREWFEKLTPDAQAGLVVHEILHLVLRHESRGRGRDRHLWNVAADLEINGLILELGGELPPGGLIPSEMGLPSMLTAEEYYQLLQSKYPNSQNDNNEQNEQGSEDEDGGGGGGLPQPLDVHGRSVHASNMPLPGDDQGQRMREAIAGTHSQLSSGRLPADVDVLIKRILGRISEIDWRQILRAFVVQLTPGEGRRRYRGTYRQSVVPDIVPFRRKQERLRIGVIVDESGSVSNDMLSAVYDELERMLAVADAIVVRTDVRAASVERYKRGDKFDRRRRCEGGTDFRDAFEVLLAEKVRGIIVMTDAVAPVWPDGCPVPVIAVVFGDGNDIPAWIRRRVYVR